MGSSLGKVCRQDVAVPENGMENWHRRTLHAFTEVVPVLDQVLDELGSAGYSGKDAFAVRLALEEALVNAIKHGHHGDESRSVHMSYQVTGECVVAEVEDEGPGFRIEEVPDPLDPENLERDCGRGLLLMRTYMTWVRYNPAGNRVTLCKRRTA
jgi:serine/threonine-protein kinase RsbW